MIRDFFESRERAWVYQPSRPISGDLPFLIPSVLYAKDGYFSHGSHDQHYQKYCLHHVKMALVNVAKGNWSAPVLDVYRNAGNCQNNDELRDFVSACGVYRLSKILADVHLDIEGRYPDFGQHEKDQVDATVAIPVADAEEYEITQFFQRIMECASEFASSPENRGEVSIEWFVPWVSEAMSRSPNRESRCFVYPEVSALVHGLFQGRGVHQGSIFLVTDTGAGTVDQSLFTISTDYTKLCYCSARVTPLGSSQIELRAASRLQNVEPEDLEALRIKKERGEVLPELDKARDLIETELREESVVVAFRGQQKLPEPRQLANVRLLFSGGGHQKKPYQSAVLDSLSDTRVTATPIVPGILGMRLPDDLEPKNNLKDWMPRLWVAYGLSFEFGSLKDNMYPSQMPNVQRAHARGDLTPEISKDQV